MQSNVVAGNGNAHLVQGGCPTRHGGSSPPHIKQKRLIFLAMKVFTS